MGSKSDNKYPYTRYTGEVQMEKRRPYENRDRDLNDAAIARHQKLKEAGSRLSLELREGVLSWRQFDFTFLASRMM